MKTAAEALVACLARIRERGWCDGTSGNFSVTTSSAPLRLLITPSGVDKGAIRPADLLEVGEDGKPLDGAQGSPSAETRLHVALARRVSAGAVLHTHSIWNTLLGERFLDQGGFRISGYEMLKGIHGVSSHEEQVFVPVVRNTQDMEALGREFERRVPDRSGPRGLLIAGHGMYCWGDDLADAYRHVEIFEFVLQLVGRRVPLAPFRG